MKKSQDDLQQPLPQVEDTDAKKTKAPLDLGSPPPDDTPSVTCLPETTVGTGIQPP
jgi:hypothetical protein